MGICDLQIDNKSISFKWYTTFSQVISSTLGSDFKSGQKAIQVFRQNTLSLGAIVAVSSTAFVGSENIAVLSDYLQPHNLPTETGTSPVVMDFSS